MDPKETSPERQVSIPEDASVVRQSRWVWLWALTPWVVLGAIEIYIGDLLFLGLSVVLAAITAGPRYLGWRKTAFILTEDHLVIIQGTLSGQRKNELPIALIDDIRASPGLFGGGLGYRTVDFALKDGASARLHFVPANSSMVTQISERIVSSRAQGHATPD